MSRCHFIILNLNIFMLLPSFVSCDTHETKESQDLKTETDLEIV